MGDDHVLHAVSLRVPRISAAPSQSPQRPAPCRPMWGSEWDWGYEADSSSSMWNAAFLSKPSLYPLGAHNSSLLWILVSTLPGLPGGTGPRFLLEDRGAHSRAPVARAPESGAQGWWQGQGLEIVHASRVVEGHPTTQQSGRK